MTPSGRSYVDYYAYIRSPEWREKADAAKRRVGYRCQVCNRNRNEVVLNTHHRTYERLGQERADDLTVLCEECHALYETNKRVPRLPDKGDIWARIGGSNSMDEIDAGEVSALPQLGPGAPGKKRLSERSSDGHARQRTLTLELIVSLAVLVAILVGLGGLPQFSITGSSGGAEHVDTEATVAASMVVVVALDEEQAVPTVLPTAMPVMLAPEMAGEDEGARDIALPTATPAVVKPIVLVDALDTDPKAIVECTLLQPSNVRSGPSTDHAAMEQLPPDTRVRVTGLSDECGGDYLWYALERGGWIATTLVACTGQVDVPAVPVDCQGAVPAVVEP